jgi:hypothetical protein
LVQIDCLASKPTSPTPPPAAGPLPTVVTGVGSDAETVYLTMWKEGDRPLIKQLTHKEAIEYAFRIIKAATEWNR